MRMFATLRHKLSMDDIESATLRLTVNPWS